MKNFLFVCLMISIICFLPSCNKTCKGVSEYYPEASQLKKYSFKPGSYWVYQDSISGVIDSQYVYSYTAQNNVAFYYGWGSNGVEDCPISSDEFSMSVASFWNGVLHDSVGFGNYTIEDNPAYLFVHYSSFTSESDLYPYPCFNFNGNLPVPLNNFTVSGQTFPTVYLYTDFTGFNSLMYHVDNVGVVKWVFNDTINGQHTWNLLRYHVINP